MFEPKPKLALWHAWYMATAGIFAIGLFLEYLQGHPLSSYLRLTVFFGLYWFVCALLYKYVPYFHDAGNIDLVEEWRKGKLERERVLNPPPPPPEPAPPPTYDDYLNHIYITYHDETGDDLKGRRTLVAPILAYVANHIPTYNEARHISVELLLAYNRFRPKACDNPIATVPLYEITDVKTFIAHIVGVCFKDEAKPMEELRKQLNINRIEISYKVLGKDAVENENRRERVYAQDFDGTNKEAVDTYLKDTPFRDFFYTPVPYGFHQKSRFEHSHVIAKQGHGKSQTLERFILSDLKTDASLVVIDPTGDMFNSLVKLDLGRPVIAIDPKETPALNPFDTKLPHDPQTFATFISFYEYFFGSLLDAEMTTKQSTLFGFLARFLLTRDGGSRLSTMLDIMDDPTPFVPEIQKLPDTPRKFLMNEFLPRNGEFKETRSQVKYRLYNLLQNPAFEAMFNATENRIDFDLLNQGAVFLVHADMKYLTEDYASIFGRLFIAKTLQMALGRADLPEAQRRPTFLYVDEAALFFDSKIKDIILQARKYKLALTLAHHNWEDVSSSLAAAFRGCGIRLKGNVEEEDYLRRTDRWAEWECKETNRPAIKLTIPFAWPDYPPERSDYQEFRTANREALTARAPPPAIPTPAEETPDEIDREV